MKGGWEPIPSALIGDTRLSLQTRAVYMLLRNLIWRELRANEETMTAEIGTVDDIARAAGCSVTAMKGYIRELRAAGWVSVSRSRRGHPFTFTVFSTPTKAESDSVASDVSEAEDGSAQRRNPTSPPLSTDTDHTEEANASSREEIISFLDEKFGIAPPGTNAGGKRLKAIADLCALDATLDSLQHAFGAADYGDRRWAVKTDIALATHYPTLTRGYSPRAAATVTTLVFYGVRPGETTEQAYERWVIEQAREPSSLLSDVFAVIGDWRDIDDIERDRLRDLAESTRAAQSAEREVEAA
jgi:hypothetical protein